MRSREPTPRPPGARVHRRNHSVSTDRSRAGASELSPPPQPDVPPFGRLLPPKLAQARRTASRAAIRETGRSLARRPQRGRLPSRFSVARARAALIPSGGLMPAHRLRSLRLLPLASLGAALFACAPDRGPAAPNDPGPADPTVEYVARQQILTELPMRVRLPARYGAERVFAFVHLWGTPGWSTVELRRGGQAWEGAVSCRDVSTVTGDTRYFFLAVDARGESVVSSSSPEWPHIATIVRTLPEGPPESPRSRAADDLPRSRRLPVRLRGLPRLHRRAPQLPHGRRLRRRRGASRALRVGRVLRPRRRARGR